MVKHDVATGPATRTSTVRWLGAWAVAWALLLSGLVLHNGLELHDAFERAVQVYLTGSLPHPDAQVETAATLDVPACPACMLQLQSVGDSVPQPRQLAELVCFGAATTLQPTRFDPYPRRLAPSRGPPLA